MNDISDLGVIDLRPDHVSNDNEHATLHRRRSTSTVTPCDRRRRDNKNINIEDYLERFYMTVELRSESIARS